MKKAQISRTSNFLKLRHSKRGHRGFSMVELMVVMLVGAILTAMAIPVFQSSMTNMQLNSVVSSIVSAISQARYQAVMNSQVYTLVLTVAPNIDPSYVVTNVTTSTASPAVSMPAKAILINGGTAATYTFTFCPNGIVSGAGGVCPPTTNTTPPALTATNGGRQENINVSTVGAVTTTRVQ